MFKSNVGELQSQQIFYGHRVLRLGIARRFHNVLEILQRDFGLAVGSDNRSQLLQRRKDKERIEHQREVLPDRDLVPEDEVKHQEQQRGSQGVHDGSLNETQAAQVANLSQL